MEFNIKDLGTDIISKTLDKLLLGYNSSEYAGLDEASDRTEIIQNYLAMKQILADFKVEK